MKFLYADITPEENQRRRQDFADMLVETFGHLLDEPEFIARCKAAESEDADQEPAALRTGHVGPEGQHGRCLPPSASPSGSFSPAAPSTPTRRAGRTPRTTNPDALPVAEEAGA